MELLKNIVNEEFSKVFSEEVFQEERISNKDAAEEVNNKQNFVGSHTYGEDIGGLGQFYASYSYGEQHPLYVLGWTEVVSQ